jgi:hypothetical protein
LKLLFSTALISRSAKERVHGNCWRLVDLSKLWERQGRQRQARELLQPLYDQFTEGLVTEDLSGARKLLQRLKLNRK